MVSGKYSALSGAVAREQALDNISANLANVNTTGFKKNTISFESLLRDAKQSTDANGINYSRIGKIGTDFQQGGMQETGNPLDVAIGGEGFFKIRKGAENHYTRSGHFVLDEDGMLKTSDGYNVIGANNQALQLADASGKIIDISDQGEITINGVTSELTVQIFNVSDNEQLKPVGNTRYTLQQGTDLPNTSSKVVQGSLETSNVNMMEEMALMISTQRKFEAHIKMLESYSKLGDKQNELGTVA